MSEKLRELVAKWRQVSERYWKRYSGYPCKEDADRRDFGLSDAYVTCADELAAALAEKPAERPADEQRCYHGKTQDEPCYMCNVEAAMPDALAEPRENWKPTPGQYVWVEGKLTDNQPQSFLKGFRVYIHGVGTGIARKVKPVQELERPRLSAEKVLSLAKGIVTAAVELAVLRGNLCYEDSPPIDVAQCAEVVTDTWNAMQGIDTCSEEECEELKQFRAALLTGVPPKEEQFKAIAKELGDNGYCSYIAVEEVLRKHLTAPAAPPVLQASDHVCESKGYRINGIPVCGECGRLMFSALADSPVSGQQKD